jgi:RNA polymerase sigma-70 factor (ECF subfamily)
MDNTLKTVLCPVHWRPAGAARAVQNLFNMLQTHSCNNFAIVSTNIFAGYNKRLATNRIQEQFLGLIKENNGIIHKVCHLYCHSAQDRQDLFQEILLQLWKAFPKFRSESKISTWMYRIALNTAIADFRKQQRRINTVNGGLSESLGSYDHDPIEQKERLVVFQQAVDRLSDVEKAIVILYLEEKSYQEMEEILGMGQAGLRVKMTRIKEKLRRQVGPV